MFSHLLHSVAPYLLAMIMFVAVVYLVKYVIHRLKVGQ